VKVKRIGFVGTKTDKVAEMTAFFRDVLGFEEAGTQTDWTVSKMPTGPRDLAEVFGPAADENLYPPEASGVVIAFIVDDVVAAREEVVAAGVDVLSRVIWATEWGDPDWEGVGWFFLRAPDGNVFVMQQFG
jgi:predicted enzyme related to lactoylglutathione lyase